MALSISIVLLLYTIYYTILYTFYTSWTTQTRTPSTDYEVDLEKHSQEASRIAMSPTPKDSDLINPSLSPKDKVKVDEKESELAPPLENHVRGMSLFQSPKNQLIDRTFRYETSKGRIIGMSPCTRSRPRLWRSKGRISLPIPLYEWIQLESSTTDIQEPTPNPVSTPLATKKNRLGATPEHTHNDREEDDVVHSSGSGVGSGSGSGSGKKEKETNNVGEVRRKVQEMTWKEGQGQGPPPLAEQEDGKDLKRKTLERNESSTLELNTSPKKAKETPSVRPSYSPYGQ